MGRRGGNGVPGVPPVVLAVAAAVVPLLPYLGKAVHADDPLFVWAARHICHDPSDFYGFTVNWVHADAPMAEVTKNPPLACYYLAAVGAALGWQEWALHLAFLLPAAGAAWGTYRLAERLCGLPLAATLAALWTPAFLVSGTTLMCDVPMLALWVWTVVWWVRGLDGGRLGLLCIAGGLVGLGALTKYYALSLVPLLAAYTWIRERRLGRWLGALLIPIAMLGLYQWRAHALYGVSLLGEAAAYATEARGEAAAVIGPAGRVVVGLAFTGGCVAGAVCYLPVLWPRRATAGALVLAAALGWALYAAGAIGPFRLVHPGRVRWDVIAHLAVFVVGGAVLLALAAADWWAHRDATSLLLALWVAGTFVFAAFVNWTVNGRSVLPLVPAAGILLARRIERHYPAGAAWRTWLPLAPAAVMAVLAADGDYRVANRARAAAADVSALLGDRAGARWFVGQEGFQFYMEKAGARPVDLERTRMQAGDWLALPATMARAALPEYMEDVAALPVAGFDGLSPVNESLGASFYNSRRGPLPWVIGRNPGGSHRLYRVRREFDVRKARIGPQP